MRDSSSRLFLQRQWRFAKIQVRILRYIFLCVPALCIAFHSTHLRVVAYDPHTLHTDYEVRSQMCRQLPALSRAIGAEHASRLVLPELLELLSDEEVGVRLAGFEALAELLDILESQTLRETVVPLIKRLLRAVPEEMIRVLAQLFGQLVIRIWPLLDEDDETPLFVEFFKGLAERPEPESRRLCAFNFPVRAVLLGGVYTYMYIRTHALLYWSCIWARVCPLLTHRHTYTACGTYTSHLTTQHTPHTAHRTPHRLY